MYFGESVILDSNTTINNLLESFDTYINYSFLNELQITINTSGSGSIGSILEKVKDTIADIFEKIIEFISNVIDKIKEIFVKIKVKIKKVITAFKKEPQFINIDDSIQITDFYKVYDRCDYSRDRFFEINIIDILSKPYCTLRLISIDKIENNFLSTYLHIDVSNIEEYKSYINNHYREYFNIFTKTYKVKEVYENYKSIIDDKQLNDQLSNLKDIEAKLNKECNNVSKESISSILKGNEDEKEQQQIINKFIKLTNIKMQVVKVNIQLISNIMSSNISQINKVLSFLESHITIKAGDIIKNDKRNDVGSGQKQDRLNKNYLNKIGYNIPKDVKDNNEKYYNI